MLVKVTSLCFAGGYNSVYEVAWEDNLREFIEYYDDEYEIKISEDEITNRKYQKCSNTLPDQGHLSPWLHNRHTFLSVRLYSNIRH